MASRRKKNNFTGSETEVLLLEIQKRKKSVIFSSVSSGIAGPAKAKKEMTTAVNSVSPVVRNVSEIKKKWFDLKMAIPMEPIPAVIGREAGYTLDKTPVHRAPCYIQSQLNLQLVHNLSQTE